MAVAARDKKGAAPSAQAVQAQITEVYKKLAGCQKRVPVLVGGAGSSKCFVRGTMVRMYPYGLKPIEQVQVGDRVMGPDSNSRTVQEVHSGNGRLYRVHQRKAMDFTVSEGHLLCLQRAANARLAHGPITAKGTPRWPNGRYAPDGDNVEIPVEQYLDKSKRWRRNFYGYRVAVDWPDLPVPIDPYFMGLWLGDGSSDTIAITTADDEVKTYVYQFADVLGMHVTVQQKTGNKAASYRVTNGNCKGIGRHKNQLLTLFQQYNLIDNKHIPDCYLFNSRGVRMTLLAGLIDTDGCLASNGFTIIQKNPVLARQIYQLASSLGFRCSIIERESTIKSIGFTGTYYSVAIYGQTDTIPTLIPHKQAAYAQKRIDPLINGIDVSPDGDGEYFGFSLDKDGLFLLEDCTVVHNSHSIGQWYLKVFVEQPQVKMAVMRKTLPSLRRTAYDLMLTLFKEYGIYHLIEHDRTNLTFGFNGATMSFLGLDDPEKIKSANFNYIWMEEATDFDYEDFLQATLRLRAPAPKDCSNKIVLSLNPIDANCWVATKLPQRDDVEIIHSTYKDNPFLDKDYIKSLEDLINQDENYYRVYVLGEWGRLENLIFTRYKQVPQIPQGCKWVYGLDFGYTHPMALIKVAMGEDGKVYLEERLHKSKMTGADLVEFLSHEDKADIFADSARPELIEELNRAGYRAYPANKSVKYGIDLMKRQELNVTESSSNTWKQLRGYCWRKDKNGVVLEEPVKFNDDAVDAARYGLAGLVERYGAAVAQGSRSYGTIKTLHFAGRR